MSFFATFSALSKNGYQAINIDSDWFHTNTINTGIANTRINDEGGPVFNSTGEYLAFSSYYTSNQIGMVHIYTNGNSGSNYTLQQTITGNAFLWGTSLSFDSNGEYLAIGSMFSANGGAAYIYNRSGNTWSLQQTLTPNNANYIDSYGASISLNGTGDYVIVGAPESAATTGVLPNQGAIFTYERTGNTWTNTNRIAPSLVGYQYFGTSLKISTDGNYFIAGGPGRATSNVNVNRGTVYYYQKNGSSWTQTLTLTGTTNNSYRGYNVGISNNGNIFFHTSHASNNNSISFYYSNGSLINTLTASFSNINLTVSKIFATMQDNTINIITGNNNANISTAIIKNDNNVYANDQSLVLNTGSNPNAFGYSVGIADLSNIAAITQGPYGNGSVYIFTKQ